jgi:eukaryotic-like serine/threonine-protein kinase
VNFSLSTIFSQHRETFARRTVQTPGAGTAQYEQYVLQKLVGAGAFSKVYRAIERSTGDTVAIKYLRKDCWYDPRASASLLREYTLLKQLNHPQILSIRGWGTTRRGALFLVSELIEGTNLETWSRTVNKTARHIIAIVRQVAEGVRAAHAIGILHGDIKPANVLMGREGRVVLCDFGFARYATAPDDVPRGGTAGFLAPEQICDQFGPITERADIYGLGGLLYSLLTGRPPMIGRDLPETMALILSSTVPVKPSTISSNSFAPLDDLALRCLAKEPSQRPANAEEVIKLLDDLEGGSPSHANI